jgi:hypothetical protein
LNFSRHLTNALDDAFLESGALPRQFDQRRALCPGVPGVISPEKILSSHPRIGHASGRPMKPVSSTVL